MEQTIKIEVPEGKKAVYNESTKTVEFVDIETIRSKSWKEFCGNHPNIKGEYYIEGNTTIMKHECNSVARISNYINHLATKEDAEGILALIQLTRLHDEWVGDWEHKDNECYHTIARDRFNRPIIMYLLKRQLLQFPTEKMAVEFLNCFEDLIEKAKKFI